MSTSQNQEKSTVEETPEQAQAQETEAHVDEAVSAGEIPQAEAIETLRVEYEAKLAEAKDQLLRAVAETENVRRRAQRDVEETGKYAVSGFARDLLTVSENLFLALSSIPEEARAEEGLLKSLADGVDMTLRELLNTFEKHGIRRINPLGERFDHHQHQAVSQVEDPGKEPNTVIHVMQAGYLLGDRLLRPAMVVVSKHGEQEQKVDTQA